MAAREYPNLHVVDHPLVQAKLTHLRDRSTGRRPFRALVSQIAGLMVYEATRDFTKTEVEIETPLERTRGVRVPESTTVVPVLRAGLVMAEGVLELIPGARVGHLGMSRDEKTLEPTTYLHALPQDLGAGPVLMVDPMLATGGSASASVKLLIEAGARDVRMLCIVAAPRGVERMLKDHPAVPVYTAALDRELNSQGFILPGLGDAGDRLYGTGLWSDR